MNPIQMVDLKSQYLRIKPELDAAIQHVLDSTAFIQGSPVFEFEQQLSQYTGSKCVISCGNGTDALMAALLALGIGKGDEVITPAFTFVSTVEVIALLGATPVFVDVCEDTFNMDVHALEKAITAKTKAILPVHLYGQCADMEPVLNVAKKHKRPLGNPQESISHIHFIANFALYTIICNKSTIVLLKKKKL